MEKRQQKCNKKGGKKGGKKIVARKVGKQFIPDPSCCCLETGLKPVLLFRNI